MSWNRIKKNVFHRQSFRKKKDHSNSKIESDDQDDFDDDDNNKLNVRGTKNHGVIKDFHKKIKIKATGKDKTEYCKANNDEDESLCSSPQEKIPVKINDKESEVNLDNNHVMEIDPLRDKPNSATIQINGALVKSHILEDEVFETNTSSTSLVDTKLALENFTNVPKQETNECQPNTTNNTNVCSNSSELESPKDANKDKLVVEKYRPRASSDSNLRRMVARKTVNEARLSLSPNKNTEKSVTFSPSTRPIRRGRCRAQFKSVSHINVKYTKVFGPDDGAYKNDTTPRGHVFMYNFEKFENNIYPERQGSETDYTNLQTLLQQMGYGSPATLLRYCKTGFITKEEFVNDLRSFSQSRFLTLSSSCIIVIMSHGSGSKTFLTSDNKEVDLMDVYTQLNNQNCTYLMGKPKLFILQFCRNYQLPLESPRNRLESVNTSINLQSEVMKKLIENEVKKQIASLLGTQCLIKTQSTYQLEEDVVLDQTDDGPKLLKQCINQTLISSMECLSLSPRNRSRTTSTASSIETAQHHSSSFCWPVTNSSNLSDRESNPMSYPPNIPHSHSSFRTSFIEYDIDEEQISSAQYYQSYTRAVTVQPHDTEGIQRFSDMYSIFSTASGELSYRDPVKGSLLVQAICHIFAEFAYQDDIDTLVRKVSSYMAKTLQKDDPITVPRQTCERTNNGLDKLFYFNPQEPPCCRSETL